LNKTVANHELSYYLRAAVSGHHQMLVSPRGYDGVAAQAQLLQAEKPAAFDAIRM
jgi:hypothetical protein